MKRRFSILVIGLFVIIDTLTASSSGKRQTIIRPQHVRNALDKNEDIYYFGLGSNMSRKKLENRGINGTKIEVKSFEAAIVPNYRLAFNMRGFPPIEPGMGSLESSNSAVKALHTYHENECHGALIKLTSDNYKKVMESEGIKDDIENPGYEEVIVDAYPYASKSKKPVKAVALRARPHVRLNFDPSPSVRYMNILKEGAKELKLKTCYQEFLEQHPVQKKLTKIQKRYVIYNLVFYRLMGQQFLRFQSRILFAVYVPATAPAFARISSEVLSTMILLPGFLIGYLYCLFSNLILGKKPDFFDRMVKFLGASD